MKTVMAHELFGCESTANLRLATVGQAVRGDIIRFKSNSLRVEGEPFVNGMRVRLEGREGKTCSYVTRWYFTNTPCVIDREPA